MRVLLLLPFLVLLLTCGGNAEKEKVYKKKAEVESKLRDFELLYVNDEDGMALVDQSRERIKAIDHLVVENEFRSAMVVLDEVVFSLELFSARDQKPESSPIRAFGKVRWQARGEDIWRDLTPGLAFSRIKAIQTGVRAGVVLDMPEGTVIHCPDNTEIILEEYSSSLIAMRLLKGSLSISHAGSLRLNLYMDELKAELDRRAKVEMAKSVTGQRYLAVYEGELDYSQDLTSGHVGRRQAILWSGTHWKDVRLPQAPVLQKPGPDEVHSIGEREETSLEFSWSEQANLNGYQLQISSNEGFTSRVHDSVNPRSAKETVTLGPGRYWWRARAFSKEGIPGPVADARVFYIKKGADTQAEAVAVSSVPKDGKAVPGPVLSNISMEVIGSMVIVSGLTDPQAKVTVNGQAAIVLAEGKFRAVIDFLGQGNQKLVIAAILSNTGGETVVVKDVYIR